MNTNMEQSKIRLQSVGWVPADEVGNLEVGDRIMWNGGETSEVTAVEQVSRCFRLISLKSSKTGEEETPRKLKTTALVARIPQAKEEPPAAHTLPTLEGHTVRAALKGTMWTVELYEDGNPEPLFTDKIGDHVPNGPGSAANVLIFAREQQLKEAAALAALDDATAYVALRSDAIESEPVTAEEAREILRQERREAGPEPVRSYVAPRMTVAHSGAFWRAVVPGKARSVVITPAVVHEAGCVISKGTGDGMVYPVAKPGIRTFGPWVRPVDGHADQVIVARVANGLHRRPSDDYAGARWDEYMNAYETALVGAGWALVERTDDGDVYRMPR